MFAIIQDAIKSKSKRYYFPISMIDDIGVRVVVNKRHLEIESNSINSLMGDDDDGDIVDTQLGMFPIQELNDDFNEEMFDKMNTILRELVFDKFIGKFVIGNVGNEEQKYITEREYIIGLNNPKITVIEKYNECCVCFCNTTTKTKCKHFICIPCADLMDEYDCGECGGNCCDKDSCGMKRCPICRETLYINKYINTYNIS